MGIGILRLEAHHFLPPPDHLRFAAKLPYQWRKRLRLVSTKGRHGGKAPACLQRVGLQPYGRAIFRNSLVGFLAHQGEVAQANMRLRRKRVAGNASSKFRFRLLKLFAVNSE